MIALIVAYAKNQVIGNKGCIPWKIKGEQSRFKELTRGNIVVMGRRSYEEIGHPLKDRTTIVVSTTKKYQAEQCFTVSSLEEALTLAGDREVFISGGARLYEEALPIVDCMYITEIDAEIEGDTYFPAFDESRYKKEVIKRIEGRIPYTYLTYWKK